MSKCPHCGEELQIPNRAYFNCDQYGKSAVVATECCGGAIHMTPVRSYRFEPYAGRETEDDWGVPFAVKEKAK